MGRLDDEREILADLGLVQDPEVCFLPEPTDRAVDFLFAARELRSWTKGERPDLYSDDLQLAIEAMRVDDHPKVGKVMNPTLARETRLEREIRTADPSIGPEVSITVIAKTGLPSEKDHNFAAYRAAFARIVGDHVSKVATYRKRHPGYALALLVYDESSAYALAEEPIGEPLFDGSEFRGQAHYWYLDAYFTQIIAGSGADFFLWHTPYKHLWHVDELGGRAKVELPALAVYDVTAMADWKGPLAFDQSLIVSVEE